jgi:hypothetical protein
MYHKAILKTNQELEAWPKQYSACLTRTKQFKPQHCPPTHQKNKKQNVTSGCLWEVEL